MKVIDGGICYRIHSKEVGLSEEEEAERYKGSGAVLGDHGEWLVPYEREGQLERWIAESPGCKRAYRAPVRLPEVAPDDLRCPEGLSYFQYQKEGIVWLMRTLNARRAALLADEMGLGKTVQVCGLINASPSIRRVLVVVPKTAKSNWRSEAERWLVAGPEGRAPRVRLADCKKGLEYLAGREADEEHVTVINYAVLLKQSARLAGITWDLLVFDEAQHLKNPRAKRTEAAVGESSRLKARHRVFLSGTFVTAKPLDLWSVLRVVDPAGLGLSISAFRMRYFWRSRACNLSELHEKIGPFILRRTKNEVGLQLPAKIRKVIPLDSTLSELRAAVEHEKGIEKRIATARARACARKLECGKRPAAPGEITAIEEQSLINAARLQTSLAKLPYVVETVNDVVAEGRKVVVFAHHHEVLHRLEAAIPGAVLLYGPTSDAARAEAIRRFQTDDACKVFIGGLLVAGTAITLTAASDVVFAELSWTPSDISQAEDRCHRIGQTEAVFIQHVLVENSFDHRLLEILLEKQQIASAIIDGGSEDPVAMDQLAERFDAWEAFGTK